MKLQKTFLPVVILLCGWAINKISFGQQSRGIAYANGVPEICNGILYNLKKRDNTNQILLGPAKNFPASISL